MSDRVDQAPTRSGVPQAPELPGPFPVGDYAIFLQRKLRERARVQVIGEIVNFKQARANAYFELRDAGGALPCAMWTNELERMGIPAAALVDGAKVVACGGPDYYPGSGQSSPSFSFRVTHLKLAGEGDLLAQLAKLREKLHDEGLFEPQKLLPRPPLPKTIGIVTGKDSAARADLLAGLERRSWRGTLVWAHPPVQNQKAAPQIGRALQDLAALDADERPDVIIVARGGGSLADLWAFCDETLCRTVALLPVPVISAIGHEVDTTLIDDVAAVACSTPTHATAAAVQLDVAEERARLLSAAALVAARGPQAIRRRAERLRTSARVPAEQLRRERSRLDQKLREIRAASTRRIADEHGIAARVALVLSRKAAAELRQQPGQTRGLARIGTALAAERDSAQQLRERRIADVATALRAHDPDRVLERGFALAEDPRSGEPVTSAEQAKETEDIRLRFADAAVRAKIRAEDE